MPHSLLHRIKRFVADLPAVLPLMERLTRRHVRTVSTPEGDQVVINTVFHSLLATPKRLAAYEPDVRAALRRLVLPGMAVYDVGANVGVFTVLCARLVGPKGAVYAFEPDPGNRRYLEDSIRRSGAASVRVDPRAVGRMTGMETFDRRGGGFSGRLVAGNTRYHRTRNILQVATVSLDDLVLREGCRPPDVLKIDVEGNEGLVLAGATRTLSAHRPTILCELHGHLGERMTQTTDLLSEHGYRLCTLDGAPWNGPTSEREHIVAARR